MKRYRWLCTARTFMRLGLVAVAWTAFAVGAPYELRYKTYDPTWQLDLAAVLEVGVSLAALIMIVTWVIKAPSLWQPAHLGRSRGKRRAAIRQLRDTWSRQLDFSCGLQRQARRLRDEHGETSVYLELGARDTGKTLITVQVPSRLATFRGFLGFCFGNSQGPAIGITHYLGTQITDPRDLVLTLYPYDQPPALTPAGAGLPLRDGPLTTEMRDRVSQWLKGEAGADGSVTYLEAWRPRQEPDKPQI